MELGHSTSAGLSDGFRLPASRHRSSISSHDAIPVDINTGLPLDAIYSISGMSVISKEAILYAGTSMLSRKSTASRSNGEEKQTNPSSSAMACSVGCNPTEYMLDVQS